MAKEVLAQGKITEEGLEIMRSRIGIKLRIHPNSGNRLACNETIRKFTSGYGDINPLFRDKEYAEKTRYGRLVAPPSWPYSVFQMGIMHGLPGVHGWHSGDDWEFFKPILEGDVISPEAIPRGIDEVPSRFSARMLKDYQDRLYYTQRGELASKALRWSYRAESSGVRETGKYAHITLPHPWTDEELEAVDEQILAMPIRGAEVRYWEDVEVGEEIPQVVKGPIGVTDELCFQIGVAGHIIQGHEAALEVYKKHPAWGFRDPETKSWEPRAAVHWLKEAARSAGLPYMYEVGMERNSWMIQMFTSWMGDEGWLKRCYAEYRAFIFLSDVVWIKGHITKKYVDENGEHCVDVDVHSYNQREETTIKGHGTVILPSRETGTWPVEIRLPK